MFEWVDSVQKHHSSVKILILIFYLVVSIIYRSNDLLDTWKTVDSQRSITPSLKFPAKDENGTVSHSPILSGSLSQIPNTTMESKMLSKCAEEPEGAPRQTKRLKCQAWQVTRPPKEKRDSLQRGDECSLLSTNLPSPNIDTTESTPHIWQPWEPEDVARSPKEELQSARETDVVYKAKETKKDQGT
jgi:hypothetical protein